MVTVRNATLSDAARLLEIYDYYVKNTAITFEYETPSLEEFTGRMKTVMARYPYLVILRDGEIEGYAYAGAFRVRRAYDWSCEVSVYLHHAARKCGMGRMLYEVLEAELKKMGIRNLYACIGYPTTEDDGYLTTNSADFHAHLGYTEVGRFHRCGYKHGRWYHMIYMEKVIGEHGEAVAEVCPYPALP